MTGLVRVGTAVLPLCLTPVLVHVIAAGHVDLGGGEKDLVLVLPWALWSFIFAACCLVFWRRRWPIGRSLAGAAIAGAAGVVAAALLLAVLGQLGVGGRF